MTFQSGWSGVLCGMGGLVDLGGLGGLGILSSLGDIGCPCDLGHLGDQGGLVRLDDLGGLCELSDLGGLCELSDLGGLGVMTYTHCNWLELRENLGMHTEGYQLFMPSSKVVDINLDLFMPQNFTKKFTFSVCLLVGIVEIYMYQYKFPLILYI